MTPLLIFSGIVVVLAVGGGAFFTLLSKNSTGEESIRKKIYSYRRRQFFMTKAEHECYKALMHAVGSDYFIFAQVHLPTIIDEKVPGQDWRAARAHINRKSVDFVLCDKEYINPRLAIELDDSSHEREDRQERDIEVERMLAEAHMPLLRLENRGVFNPQELTKQIQDAMQHSQ
jgi:very-short-patch-repair endonuclease